MVNSFSIVKSTFYMFVIMGSTLCGCMILFSTLSLYFVHHLHLSDSQAVVINSAFSALQFAFAIVGGEWGARFGHQRTSCFGGVLLIVAMLLFLAPIGPFIPLAFFIIGLGCFVPNCLVCLGQIFQPNDAKRSAAYTLVYLGMNVGAMMGIIMVGWLVAHWGWSVALSMGAIAFLVMLLMFLYGYPRFPFLPESQCTRQNQKSTGYVKQLVGLVFISILSMIIFIPLLQQYTASEWFMAALWFVALGYIIVRLFREPSLKVRKTIAYLILLMMVLSLFFIPYYLEVTVLPLFTDSYIDKMIMGHAIPAVTFFALNPLFNIVIGLIMLFYVWRRPKAKTRSDWRIYSGVAASGLAFLLLAIVIMLHHQAPSLSAVWLLPVYGLLCLAEMLAVPALYSIVPEFATPALQGIFMGFAQLASGMGAIICGAISAPMMAGQKSTLQLLNIQHGFFWTGLVITVIGLLLWTLSKPIRRMFQ
jgi:POT family proton-dependent oligopeptide transporter